MIYCRGAVQAALFVFASTAFVGDLYSENIVVELECQIVEVKPDLVVVTGTANLPVDTSISVCLRAIQTNEQYGCNAAPLDNAGRFKISIKPFPQNLMKQGDYTVHVFVAGVGDLLNRGFTFSGPHVTRRIGFFGLPPVIIDKKFEIAARNNERDALLAAQQVHIHSVVNDFHLIKRAYIKADAAGLFVNYPKYPRHPKLENFMLESSQRLNALRKRIDRVELIDIEFELDQAYNDLVELINMILADSTDLKYYAEKEQEFAASLESVTSKLPK